MIAAWLPLNAAGTNPDHAWSNPDLERSRVYDYESISSYGSYTGGDFTPLIGPVFTRRDNGELFYMGGNPNKNLAGPSRGDIARLAQMYPRSKDGSTGAENPAQWQPKRVGLNGRGVEFDVMLYPPNGSSEYAEAVEREAARPWYEIIDEQCKGAQFLRRASLWEIPYSNL